MAPIVALLMVVAGAGPGDPAASPPTDAALARSAPATRAAPRSNLDAEPSAILARPALLAPPTGALAPPTDALAPPTAVTPPHPTVRTPPAPPGLGPHLARQLRHAPITPTRALLRGIDPAHLSALGVTVEATVGPIHAVRIPDAPTARRLASLGAVLERPMPLHTTLDLSRVLVGADRTDFGDGFVASHRGRGALVGAYDSGLDLGHPDFRRLDGSTRVVAAWDQDAQLSCDERRLAAGDCPHGDTFGHGTHVTSIAAGSGPRYRGMAPEADLVMVSSELFEMFVPALAFMHQVAQGRAAPLVVNISLGGHLGAHDGTSLESQAIDAFPHLVVVAAGNEAGTPIHAHATLARGTPADVALRLPFAESATRARAIIDVWGATTASITATVLAVESGRIIWSAPPIGVGGAGRTERIASERDLPLGTVDLDAEAALDPDNGRPHLAIAIEAFPLGDVVLALRLQGQGEVHAWVDAPADEPLFPRFAGVAALGLPSEVLGDDALTLSDLASARRALSVSAMVSRTSVETSPGRIVDVGGTLGGLADFTSNGPSLDPARTGAKPELTAPGHVVVGAASRTIRPDGPLYRVLAGTSMAVPHVAGAAAVLLEIAPGATIDDLRGWLLGSAQPPPDDDPRWGAGILDVPAAAVAAGAETTGCGCATTARSPAPAALALILLLMRPRRRAPA